LGSVTGTWPGTLLPGGHALLPLNWDIFTQDFVLSYVNSYFFTNFMGILNSDAAGTATLNMPALPGSALDLVMYYAFLVGPVFDFASNPVSVKVVH
ncbi:MAG: hypothetical protein ABIK28_06890, partial [Planctomycetota bacterium]